MIRLGVNIDHIATVREARKTNYPSPTKAILLAELAGADNITCHLREDRRHIQDHDVFTIQQLSHLPLNFEMAATEEMLKIALKLRPHSITLVPEKREELTTEGGLLFSNKTTPQLKKIIHTLREAGCVVSLFIDPDFKTIDQAKNLDAQAIEIHTGTFCSEIERVKTQKEKCTLVKELSNKTKHGVSQDLQVHIGHGINYTNAHWIQHLEGVQEANIGHAIISQAIFCGLEKAIRQMKELLNNTQHKPYFI